MLIQALKQGPGIYRQVHDTNCHYSHTKPNFGGTSRQSNHLHTGGSFLTTDKGTDELCHSKDMSILFKVVEIDVLHVLQWRCRNKCLLYILGNL